MSDAPPNVGYNNKADRDIIPFAANSLLRGPNHLEMCWNNNINTGNLSTSGEIRLQGVHLQGASLKNNSRRNLCSPPLKFNILR